jgi:hypothetical protein
MYEGKNNRKMFLPDVVKEIPLKFLESKFALGNRGIKG